MSTKGQTLLIIDPQNDFMDGYPNAALPVAGASADMKRLATYIRSNISRINQILITMDSHGTKHIAHSMMWVDRDGNHPQPFTTISLDDVQKRRWRASRKENQEACLSYVTDLNEGQKYTLTIWPPHCLIGSPGHLIEENLFQAVQEWETYRDRNSVYYTKGENWQTEHYSAVQAEIPVWGDPRTSTNEDLIHRITYPDQIVIAGEALSHCVAATIRDLIPFMRNSKKTKLSKYTILQDCTSPVPGFEQIGEDFLSEMKILGMNVITTSD